MDPLLTGAGLALLGGYALVVVLLGTDYLYTGGGAHYLSPFYSPDLETIFGFDVPFSTALLVVWAPLGLRATCYYYRKTYYRSYFLAPPACAVRGAARPGKYAGESRLPFILQNAHRYFFYVAVVVLGFLWYDAIRAFFFDGSVGLGLGTLVLVLNVVAADDVHLRLQLTAAPGRRPTRLFHAALPGRGPATGSGRASRCSTSATRSGRG